VNLKLSRKEKRRFLFLICIGFFLMGCEDRGVDNKISKKDSQNYAVTGSTGWNATWYINNQPVFCGHGQYILEVSNFITNGLNTARCVATRMPKYHLPHDFKLIKTKNLFSNEFASLWSSSLVKKSDVKKIDITFQFKSDNKKQWRWVFSQKIKPAHRENNSNLSDKAILIINALKSGDFDLLEQQESVLWESKKSLGKKEIKRDLEIKKLLQKNGSCIEVASKKDLHVIFGSKIALVYANNKNLFSTGQILVDEKSKTSMSFVIPYMFFIRENDRWIRLKSNSFF